MGLLIRSFLSLVFFALLSACSLDASLEGNLKVISPPSSSLPAVNVSKSTGLVSGSTQNATAPGYVIQSTLGSYSSGITQTTADGDYQIYGSVQGTLLSQ